VAFITFEGIEGCGKSTQLRLLAERLGPRALETREPGGTAIGRAVREIVLSPSTHGLAPMAELLLYFADRAQHVAEVIRPALADGRIVLCDRHVESSLAYQGYGRGLPLDEVRRINQWAMGDVWPDLVVLLTIPADVTDERMRRRQLDRFEQAGDDFHARVDRGFAEMAAGEPERWVVVDASNSKEAVSAAIRTAVKERLGL